MTCGQDFFFFFKKRIILQVKRAKNACKRELSVEVQSIIYYLEKALSNRKFSALDNLLGLPYEISMMCYRLLCFGLLRTKTCSSYRNVFLKTVGKMSV